MPSNVGPPHRVLEFFRSPAGGAVALLTRLRQHAGELGREPGVREIVVLRDDREVERVVALHALADGGRAEEVLTRLAVQAAAMSEAGLVSEPPVAHPLVTLWEREFDAEGTTVVIVEIVTHASTWRHFADLLMPLALQGVGEFPMTYLRICHVRDEPARFFVIAQFPGPDDRDSYVASSFRRDQVLPSIGPYLVGRVRRYTLTPIWRAAA